MDRYNTMEGMWSVSVMLFTPNTYWMQMLHTDTYAIASYLRRVDYYSHIKQKHDNRVIQIYS